MNVETRNSAIFISEDLSRLFEGLGEGMVVTNRFGEIVVMNRASERIFGLTNDINLRKNSGTLLRGLCDPNSKRQVHAAVLPFNQTIATGHSVNSREFLLKRSDGKELYVQYLHISDLRRRQCSRGHARNYKRCHEPSKPRRHTYSKKPPVECDQPNCHIAESNNKFQRGT